MPQQTKSSSLQLQVPAITDWPGRETAAAAAVVVVAGTVKNDRLPWLQYDQQRMCNRAKNQYSKYMHNRLVVKRRDLLWLKQWWHLWYIYAEIRMSHQLTSSAYISIYYYTLQITTDPCTALPQQNISQFQCWHFQVLHLPQQTQSQIVNNNNNNNYNNDRLTAFDPGQPG